MGYQCKVESNYILKAQRESDLQYVMYERNTNYIPQGVKGLGKVPTDV